MANLDDLKKLAVLLPHWTEHNAEHAEEFREWAQRAEVAGRGEAAAHIRAAAAALEQANQALAAALRDLNAPQR
jgi:phosphoglycerate-specific signal transduction histidine kinase